MLAHFVAALPGHRIPVLAAGVSLLLLLGYGFWIAGAPSAHAPTGDAIVVHAGQGGRLLEAIRLAEQGAAPTLVIMLGETVYRGYARDLCGQVEPFEVLCPNPMPATTVGEARALREIAATRGWEQVIVVTSDYHLRRATYLDRRCSGVGVVPISVTNPELSTPSYLARIAREMVAMVPALAVRCS